jgi:hypothetical protein
MASLITLAYCHQAHSVSHVYREAFAAQVNWLLVSEGDCAAIVGVLFSVLLRLLSLD